jgi:hypothetical protein
MFCQRAGRKAPQPFLRPLWPTSSFCVNAVTIYLSFEQQSSIIELQTWRDERELIQRCRRPEFDLPVVCAALQRSDFVPVLPPPVTCIGLQIDDHFFSFRFYRRPVQTHLAVCTTIHSAPNVHIRYVSQRLFHRFVDISPLSSAPGRFVCLRKIGCNTLQVDNFRATSPPIQQGIAKCVYVASRMLPLPHRTACDCIAFG